MSSSAFDGTPARREDVSMRLRVQRMKNVSEQTKLLEEESRKMEERLQELKLAMGREKEEREKQGGGFWKTGQQGVLTKHAQVVLNNSGDSGKAKDLKPRKIKVIKDEPIASAAAAAPSAAKAPAVPGTMAFLLQKESAKSAPGNHQRGSATADRSTANASKGGLQCGQCEQKTAVVSCFECSEQYCAHCFASFHLRGALKKHRSAPLIGAAPTAAAAAADNTAQSQADQGVVAALPAPGASAPPDRTEDSGSAKRWAVPASQHSMAAAAASSDKRNEEGSNSSKVQATVAASQSSRKSEGRSTTVAALPLSAALTAAVSTPDAAAPASSLLDGTFSEADSAQSFQDALKQWRTSGTASSAVATGIKRDTQQSSAALTGKLGVRFSAMETFRTASPSCVDEGTSTASLKPVAYEPEFQSSGGITYADRLLLKTHRRTELGSLPDGRSSSNSNSGSSSSRRVANGLTPAQTLVDPDYRGSGEEEADDVSEPEQAIDFMQLRDLVTPSCQDDSTHWQNATVVAFDIVEADDLSNDANFEQQIARYKVIEDGEVLEDSAAPMTPKTSRRKSSHKGHSQSKKEDMVPAPASSAHRSKTSILQATSSSTIPAVQSSPMKVELPVKAAAKELAAPGAGSATSEDPKRKTESSSKPVHHARSNSGVDAATVADGTVSQMPASARSDRGAQSRASNRARPSSRARSRAERAAELRNGGLSLEATENLKSVSRRSQDTVIHPGGTDRGLHVDALGEFFRLWLPQEPVERTLTPTSQKQNKDVNGSGSLVDIQRHHISNKVYQTSPQVWRPQSSMADTVTEEEAIRCVSALPADMVDQSAAVVNGSVAASGDEKTQLGVLRNRDHTEAMVTKSDYSSTNVAGRASPMQTASTTVNSSREARRATTTQEALPWAKRDADSAHYEALLPPKQSQTPRAQRGQQNPNRKSNAFSVQGSHAVGESISSQRHDDSSSRISLRRATSKDSLTSYDMLGDRTPRSSDGSDELRTLDDLERELASHTGRLTADGITSCLPDSLDAEEQDAATSDNDDHRSTQQDQPDPLNDLHKRSWDLRESMMHDFDDMEQAFADESNDLA